EQAAAIRQHFAEELGEAFVDPEELPGHRLLVAGDGESRGPAVLAIPRMHELVCEESAHPLARFFVGDAVLVDAVIARLVMFQSEMLDLVTQGEQPVVMPIMVRSEEC